MFGVFTQADLTVSAVDTEQDLVTIPCAGRYQLRLDVNNLAINTTPVPAVPEEIEVILRASARPGGTERVIGTILVGIAKLSPLVILSDWFDVPGTGTLRVTQYTGTARAVPYALLREGFAYYGQVDSTGATASAFRGGATLDGFGDDYFNGQFLSFLTGALSGQTQPVTDFADANNVLTFTSPNVFTAAPANAVWYGILNK